MLIDRLVSRFVSTSRAPRPRRVRNSWEKPLYPADQIRRRQTLRLLTIFTIGGGLLALLLLALLMAFVVSGR